MGHSDRVGNGMGNNRGSMDSVVGDHRDWVSDHRGSMDGVVDGSQVGGVVAGGDDNTSVADGGVVGDVTTDPGHQGPQCDCCYLNISYWLPQSVQQSDSVPTFILVCPTVD